MAVAWPCWKTGDMVRIDLQANAPPTCWLIDASELAHAVAILADAGSFRSRKTKARGKRFSATAWAVLTRA